MYYYCDNKVRNVCSQVANPHPKPNPNPKPDLVSNFTKKNVEKSKFQEGFEPTTYRSAGKHATHTATGASLAMTYSTTHFS